MSRYMIKLKGGKTTKIKRWYFYTVTSDDHDFYINFQEQWENSDFLTHTHIWIHNEVNEAIVADLFEHMITGGMYYLPKKTELVAFIQGYGDEREHPDPIDFNKPFYTIELVVTRKLSETLIAEIELWLNVILYEFIPYVNMGSLFNYSSVTTPTKEEDNS